MRPPTKDWQAHVDRHKRVGRFGWAVVVREHSKRVRRGPPVAGLRRWLPNWLELSLALALAVLLAVGWLTLSAE